MESNLRDIRSILPDFAAAFLDGLLQNTPLPKKISVGDGSQGECFDPAPLVPVLRRKLYQKGVGYTVHEILTLEAALSLYIQKRRVRYRKTALLLRKDFRTSLGDNYLFED